MYILLGMEDVGARLVLAGGPYNAPSELEDAVQEIRDTQGDQIKTLFAIEVHDVWETTSIEEIEAEFDPEGEDRHDGN